MPAFCEEVSSSMKFIQKSGDYSEFNRSLPKQSEFRVFDEPETVNKPESSDDFLDEFDSEGFRKPKKVSTEKKVIKHIKDYDGKPVPQHSSDSKPMNYYDFPRTLEDANNSIMPMGMPAMF